MGGSSYDRDVYGSSSYANWGASSTAKSKLKSSYLADEMLPNNKILKSTSKNPIIIVLDVTGSNINFARLVYDKLPMFYGEIEKQGYLKDFDMVICAVGDAYSDDYPIQIGEFAKGIELDSWIEKLVLESGGGGSGQESYELMAYYLLNKTEFEKGTNPIIFFIGDEQPYDQVKKEQAIKFGMECDNDLNPFPELNKKFNNNVFMMLNKYCGRYFDNNITNYWERILPAEHVFKIKEEKAIVDMILGILALKGKRNLDLYALDMKNRGQTNLRIANVTDSLAKFANSSELMIVEDVNADLVKARNLVKKPNTNIGKRI